jgi:Tol biopolymer transport system component/DNA-binding winged helix-turn-helix (wHTH) protein
MSPQISERRVCRFGLYEADLDAGILKRHGIPLKLQEQPFRVLTFLLERPGELITRDELRTRLWPEGTFVEFDGSLNTALMKLRAVLNDNSENPRFVETVPKKGYRFIAPVQVLPSSTEPARAPTALRTVETTAPVSSPHLAPETMDEEQSYVPAPIEITVGRHVSLKAAALFFAGILVAVTIMWRYWPMPEPRVRKISQLTHTGRVAPGSRIITDGARLYFLSREGGRSALMTTSIHGGSVEKLSSPFENTAIFDLSPDHTQLLIGPLATEGDEIPLWIWPAHGGVPHRLGDVTASEAAWSPKGDSIAIVQGNRILTVRRNGSAATELQKFSSSPHSLVWCGDGKTIRFTVTNPDRVTDEIWQIDSNGKNLTRVFPKAPPERHDRSGAWSADERYFLFTGGSDSRLGQVMDSISNIWIFRERTSFLLPGKRRPIELTHGPVSFHSLAATGDSDRFFALGTHPEYQLVRMNPLTTSYDVILPDAGASDVDVTPDGEWLVYSLRESGALWKSRRNGKQRSELTALPPGALAPEWSPDGKEILFTAFLLDKRSQLYIVPSSGGTPHPILPAAALGSIQTGDWSPDGKRIVFDYSEHGDLNIRILDRASANIETLPDSQGIVQPRWSPDGKRVVALNSKTHQIVLYALDEKKWSVLAEAASAQGLRWSSDGTYIYYQEMGDPEQAVYRIRPANPSVPEKIVGFGRMLNSLASQCHFTGVAPDGSIYVTLDRGGTDVYALDIKLP